MKVSFIGVGKLGFPCAMAAAKHHDVVGYDTSSWAKETLVSRKYPHREAKAQEYLNDTKLRIVDTLDEAVLHGDVVFIAVQTPHQPEYEGITRMPEERVDFDYDALKKSVKDVSESAKHLKRKIVLCVISTVLPGTSERELYPLLNEYTYYAYNPFFIAMGTTIDDYEKPEFHLLGVDDRDGLHGREAANLVRAVYEPITGKEVIEMSIVSAEMTKVTYNTAITLKITMANTVMEICERLGGKANCDDVTRALSKATDRVVSSKYMRGGMGDGGHCHPRDNIALSWLSRKLGLSYNLYDSFMRIREFQTEWLADMAIAKSKSSGLPIIILGKAFKAECSLVGGSPGILLFNILREKGQIVQQWDPFIDAGPYWYREPAVFIIATNHDYFYRQRFPVGSIVIDPWGNANDQAGCEVIKIGRKN